jgi:hypothetical protein
MSSLIKNTANQSLPFTMFSLASANPTTGLTPIALVGKNGAALATITGVITSTGNGAYNCSLGLDDTNGNVLHFLITGTSCVPAEFVIYTVGYNPTGTNIPASVVNNVSVGTMVTHVTVATSGILAASFVSAALTSVAMAADFITRIANSVADTVWDEATSGHTTTGSFGEWFQVLHQATIQSANATSIVLNTGAASTDGIYNTAMLYCLAGTGAGQARAVVSYVGSTRTARVNVPFAVTLGSDSLVQLLPNGADAALVLSAIGSVVWEEPVTIHTSTGTAGRFMTRMDTSVGNISGGSGSTETSIASAVWAAATRTLSAGVTIVAVATDAITSAAFSSDGAGRLRVVDSIATGAITSLALSSDAVTRLGTGDVNVVAINGVSIAAEKLAKGAGNMSRGEASTGSSTVSIVVASIHPALSTTDQIKGGIVIFNHDTTTANLRGQRAAITSSTSGVLSVTTLSDAPASGDTFIVV